jgi:hypothetical protein
MATAEADVHATTQTRGDPRGRRPAADAAGRWRGITTVYRQAAGDLRQKGSFPTSEGASAGD